MSTDDPDIFAGLTFADDFAREQVGGPRAVDAEPPDPDRDGEKWRGKDPRLPEGLTRRLEEHLAAARTQLRVAARRGDAAAAAAARRRIDLVLAGSGDAAGQWWTRTVAEASAAADAALAELDGSWDGRGRP